MLLNINMSSTLVLAPDYQPVSYLPLSTISWQMAIKLFFLDKVTVLEWHDDWIVHSAKLDMRVPAVIVAKRGFNRSRGKMKFSRQNLYLRDLYTCQYCEDTISGKNLTLDHVIPISRGGKTTWENSVTACRTCNIAKGSSKGWQPIKTPIQPDYWRLVSSMKNVPLNVRHPSWQKYIGVKEATVIRRSA
jgi:5-methylcytosine-specific restriction endonuclease McrA